MYILSHIFIAICHCKWVMAALSALPIMEPSAYEFMSNFKAKLMFPRLKKKNVFLMFSSCTSMDCFSYSNLGNIPFWQYGFVSVCVLLISFTIGKRDLKNTTLNKTVTFFSFKWKKCGSRQFGAEMVTPKIIWDPGSLLPFIPPTPKGGTHLHIPGGLFRKLPCLRV